MRVLALLIAVSLSGCSATTSALPKWVVDACASVRALPPYCVDRGPPGRGRAWTMEIANEPRLSFLTLDRGGLIEATGVSDTVMRAFGLAHSVARPVASWPPVSGRRALDGGTRHWGGLTGHVLLSRASEQHFPDRVAFTWLDGSRRRLIATGAARHAIETLQAIVSEMPRTPPTGLVAAPPVAGVAMIRTPTWVATLCDAELGSPCPTRLPRPGSRGAVVQVLPHNLDIAWGGESGDASVDRPPRLVHLTLSDRDGRCFSNHVCHRSGHQLVSIHRWSPLRQTLKVFRAVIRST